MGFCSKGLSNEFETVVVNEPSVFEPLKFNHIFYFILLFYYIHSTVYSILNSANRGQTVYAQFANSTILFLVLKVLIKKK